MKTYIYYLHQLQFHYIHFDVNINIGEVLTEILDQNEVIICSLSISQNSFPFALKTKQNRRKQRSEYFIVEITTKTFRQAETVCYNVS